MIFFRLRTLNKILGFFKLTLVLEIEDEREDGPTRFLIMSMKKYDSIYHQKVIATKIFREKDFTDE